MRKPSGLLVLVLAVAACQPPPHVQLGPLPPDPTPTQRVQLFNELHATAERTTVTQTCRQTGGCSTDIERTLFLANGTQVHYPEDILPVIAGDSAAAQSARASVRSRKTRRTYSAIAVVGVVVAAIAFSQGIKGDGEFSSGAKLGLLGGGAAIVVGAAGAYYYTQKAADEHGAANEQYNVALANRLKVCVTGLAVVPCETSGSQPPATPK